ncbi:hypothetical protein Ahy_A10g049970 [Arachis hypogaea]|uniref:MOM1 alpha-helical domain-containing protein n=1 Tax=Arachis hypogaea TaxID=3818 RepID=A0A445B8B8_ARAHY|nr:hypothetical protein Ahy_A10g049970 [Arachis hypogaea]
MRAATTTPSCFWPSPKSSNQFPEITKLQKSPKHSSPSSHTQPSALFAVAYPPAHHHQSSNHSSNHRNHHRRCRARLLLGRHRARLLLSRRRHRVHAVTRLLLVKYDNILLSAGPFTDNVRDMVDNFLEFVVNNHHVNREREPVSMLQAFQISLVRTAISNIFI